MGRSLLFEIVEMVLEFPVAVGKALLVTAWTIWQTRIPRIIKILLVGILAPAGALLVLVHLLAEFVP